MCFYIFKEDGRIRLRYALESIFLFGKKGTSIVIADFLIENMGTSTIKEVSLLYPNALHEDRKIRVIDSSERLTEDHATQMYTLEGKTFKIKEGRTLELTEPDMDDISKDITFSGSVFPCKIVRHPRLSDTHYEALGRKGGISFSFFNLIFPEGIEPSKGRWVRLIFLPDITALTIKEELPYRFLRGHAKKSTYQICGPLDVGHRFKERLISFKQVHSKGREQLIASDLEEIIQNPSLASITEFDRYRLMICSPDSSIRFKEPKGSVDESDSSPRYDKDAGFEWYIFNMSEGNFNISFELDYKTTFYKLLPFLSFALGLLAIFLTLIIPLLLRIS